MEAAAASPPLSAPPLTAVAGNPFGDALAVKVERVMSALDCSRSQVYAMVKSGKLEAVQGFGAGAKKPGVRITVASIYRLINGETEASPELTPAERAANGRRPNRAWMAG